MKNFPACKDIVLDYRFYQSEVINTSYTAHVNKLQELLVF